MRFSDDELAGHCLESGRAADALVEEVFRAAGPKARTFGEAWDDPACQEMTLSEFKILYGDPRGKLVVAGLIPVRREGAREPRGVRRYAP